MARVASAAVVEEVLLRHPAVKAGCYRVASRVALVATGLAYQRAFDTGFYAAMIRAEPGPGRGALVVAHAKYSLPLEQGTGIYGPEGRPIVPVHGKVLRFVVKAGAPTITMQGRQSQTVVFAKSVKGFPGRHVLGDAAKEVVHSIPGAVWIPSAHRFA